MRCEACFWLEKVKGVKTPGLPAFNLNTNTDTLLKKDFDEARQIIDDWRHHYDTERPHSSLNYMTPAAYAKRAA